MRLYIAGPMSGHALYNFPAFFAAADLLTARGYDVENPATNDGPCLSLALARTDNGTRPRMTWEAYMKRDIVRLSRCDGVAVLPDWIESRGAQLEVHIANALNMPVAPVLSWGPR